jgi:hypothetical protein
MSLSGTFNPPGAVQAPLPPAMQAAKRLPPFSIRLSQTERARLAVEAAGAPLGAYIKAKVLGETPPLRVRRTGLAVEDRQALAQVLALLGRSNLANNLNQLARAVHTGSLLVTPETEAELVAALEAVRDLRRQLLVALGLKAEGSP